MNSTPPITICPPRAAEGVEPDYHIPRQTYSPPAPEFDEDDLRRLARIKLASAFVSLGYRGNAAMKLDEKVMAWAWCQTEDFKRWCASAGLEAGEAYRRAMEVYERGL